MLHAVRQRVTIGQDGTITLHVPELKPGSLAVVIILEAPDQKPKHVLNTFIGKGRGCYKSVDEVDDFIRNERILWD